MRKLREQKLREQKILAKIDSLLESYMTERWDDDDDDDDDRRFEDNSPAMTRRKKLGVKFLPLSKKIYIGPWEIHDRYLVADPNQKAQMDKLFDVLAQAENAIDQLANIMISLQEKAANFRKYQKWARKKKKDKEKEKKFKEMGFF